MGRTDFFGKGSVVQFRGKVKKEKLYYSTVIASHWQKNRGSDSRGSERITKTRREGGWALEKDKGLVTRGVSE